MSEAKSTADILREARALIEDERRWCFGAYARTKADIPTSSTSHAAVKWCSWGAIDHIARENHGRACRALDLLDRAARNCGNGYLNAATLNDTLGHTAVMQMYDKAIELAETE